jgi:hypothetical protein
VKFDRKGIAVPTIAELERSLEAAHQLLDRRAEQNAMLAAEIIRLGGEAPPWGEAGKPREVPPPGECDHTEWVRQDAIGIDRKCRVCQRQFETGAL